MRQTITLERIDPTTLLAIVMREQQMMIDMTIRDRAHELPDFFTTTELHAIVHIGCELCREISDRPIRRRAQ